MFPKMAHKLTDKVLHPHSIEKTNVGLADAAFHEYNACIELLCQEWISTF